MYMQIHKTDFREILEEHNYLMPYPINLIFSELGDNQVFFQIKNDNEQINKFGSRDPQNWHFFEKIDINGKIGSLCYLLRDERKSKYAWKLKYKYFPIT